MRLNFSVGDVIFVESPSPITIFKQASMGEWRKLTIREGYFRVLGVDDAGIQVEEVSRNDIKSSCRRTERV